MRRAILILAAVFLTGISLLSYAAGLPEKGLPRGGLPRGRLPRGRLTSVSHTGIELGTYVKIVIITKKSQEKEALETINEMFGRIEELDRTFDYRKEGGGLLRFNDGELLFRKNNEELFGLLEYSLDIARATDGFFDPTILPVVQAWGFDTDSPRLPAKHEITHALERVDYRAVRVLEGRIEKPGAVKLDLSGVAKGRIVDIIRDDLRNRGYGNFLIDAGGDVYVSGKNVHRRLWRIAIQDPVEKSGFRGIVEKTDTAVVTSGDYERFFIKDGVRYSHLFNPKTGYPYSDLKSVTVLLHDTAFADAVATAVFVMGSERGYEFLIENSMEGYFILVDAEGTVATRSTPDFWN
ncbi:MAG TPA: FAD:protein FMN transferase [Spirochaetota bacterium]|nr:FAD:protein FMN transferase [Spirochaetota bacterium]